MKKQKFLWLSLIFALIMSVSVITAFAAGEPTLTVKTTSLELENAVYMNFKVQAENISDTSSVKLLVWESYLGEYVKGTEDAELSVMKTEAGTGYLVFQYTDLAAKDMTKFVYVCAYANVNGEDVYSKPTKFSIVQYAYNTQTNASASESLKTLVNNMLAYGASAQTYFDYKTDFLATDPIVKIRVEGGTHADGFKTMYYQKGEMALLTANDPEVGKKFSHWENSAGDVVITIPKFYISVYEDETYTAVFVDENYHNHTEVVIPAKKATCTEMGLTEGKYCSECNEVLVKQETIPAKGHTEVIVAGKAASCTEPGMSEGKYCSVCNTVLVSQSTISPKGHTEVVDKAKAPTCSEEGLTEGKSCSVCGKIFVTQESIPVIDHQYVNGACKMCGLGVPTSLEYFNFTKLTDGTYSIAAENIKKMPKDVVIPSEYNGVKVTELADDAFFECDLIETVFIPHTITHIGDFALLDCENLIEIKVDAKNTEYCSIDGSLYSKDAKILYCYINVDYAEEVSIPEGVVQIASDAFSGVTERISTITTIIVPSSVQEIWEWAFCSVDNLELIQYEGTKAEWDKIEKGANWEPSSGDYEVFCWHEYSSGLTYSLSNDGTYYIVTGIGSCKDIFLSIPPTYNGKPVQEVGPYAFNENTTFRTVRIPESVKVLQTGSFSSSKVERVILSEGLERINGFAFSTSENLTNINFPESLVFIGGYAFIRCFGLTELYVPGETKVEGHAFEFCKNLKKVVISNDNAIVMSGAFAFSVAIESFDVPGLPVSYNIFGDDDDDYLEGYTFGAFFAEGGPTDGSGLKIVQSVYDESLGRYVYRKFTVPDKLKYLRIGGEEIISYAFENCTMLETIVLREGVKNISGKNVFEGCNPLDLYLPRSLETICELPCHIENNTGSRVFVPDIETWLNISNQRSTKSHSDYYALYVDGKLLTEVVIPETVSVIKDNAFIYLSQIKSVVFHDEVTEIGASAFEKCSLNYVLDLPEKLSVIGNNAFYSTGIKGINFNSAPLKIGSSAFADNPIKKLIIPENVIEFGAGAFSCATLESVECNATVKTLYCSAFGGMITHFRVPEGVEELKGNFDLTYDLTSIELPTSVVTVDKRIFHFRWNAFKYVYYKGSAEDWAKVDWPEFAGYCYYYSETAPTSPGNYWRYVDGVPTAWEANYYWNEEDSTYTVSGVDASVRDLVIPAYYNGYPVTRIGLRAFQYCDNLRSVRFEEGSPLVDVGEEAFWRSANLETIIYPDGLINIEKNTISDCTSLISIYIPKTVTKIANLSPLFQYLYYGGTKEELDIVSSSLSCDSEVYFYSETEPTDEGNYWHYNEYGEFELWEIFYTEDLIFTYDTDKLHYVVSGVKDTCTDSRIVIPARYNGLSVEKIEDYAFKNNCNIETVVLPNSIKVIGKEAFYGCVNLETIEIPRGLTSIGERAFYGCASLYNVDVYAKEIGKEVFAYCNSLLDLTLGQVEIMGSHAFAYCENLSVVDASNAKTIGEYAFYECVNLRKVDFENLQHIGAYAFYGCSRLESVTITSLVETIGELAFAYCQELILVDFESSVSNTSIGNSAFYHCDNLEGVLLSTGVTSIGEEAFKSCKNLTYIEYKGLISQWNSIEFGINWNADIPAQGITCSDGMATFS